MPLPVLRDWYRGWLFDDFLPFMDAHVIDRQYGGFMCNADRDGTLLSTDKRAGFLGRGVWVYSRLYRTFGRNAAHLETARGALDFLLGTRDANGRWSTTYTREGIPKGTPPPSVNAELYIAEGINEYALATGNREYRALAREILFASLAAYDAPGYLPGAGKTLLGPDEPPVPGAAVLDDWMLFLRLATEMLPSAPDPEIERLAKRCRESITNNFYNPAFGLITEYLAQDLTRFGNALDRFVPIGNDFQTLWHMLDEAARTGDRKLFTTTASRLRRHVEVAWDDVFGGLFGTLRDVDANVWTTDKIGYVQMEALLGLLMVIEHTGADWARDWYGRIFAYMAETFPLKRYGHPLWLVSGDRRATFTPHTTRTENYHYPRHLILSIEALKRMIKRDGKVKKIG